MPGHKSSRIYLIRHGHSTANAKSILAGRDPKVSLTPNGTAQAESLAQSLAAISFAKIYSSPLPRCLETVAPIVRARANAKVEKLPGVIEMDYGKWSGKKLKALSKLSLWKTIQNRPSLVRFPDGESFLEMSDRAFSAVRGAAIGGKNILICSHGDVIKSIISSALGSNFDNFQRISVDPASISIIEINGDSSRVISVNGTSHLIKTLSNAKSGRSSRNFLLGGGSGEKTK